MSSESTIPSPRDFFLNAAPYQQFDLNSENFADALRIQFFEGTLDTFCIICKNDSIFQSTARLQSPARPGSLSVDEAIGNNLPVPWGAQNVNASELEKHVRTDRLFEVRFECSRDNGQFMAFFVRVTPNAISKVGQTPSLADLQTHRIKKYRRLLGPDKWMEFSKAVGLKAHGVGIGAFVYLRRVFEHVIERAHAEARNANGWDEQAFVSARMEDKIKKLEEYLPEFLVRNRRIYPILGKGIHDLNDAECLELFDPIQVGIELILDEEIERTETAKKIREAQTALDGL
jgi:hypothetical protein